MMSPPGWKHARIVNQLGRLLGNFVAEHPIGTVGSGDPGFWIARSPDTVRASDVAFVRSERTAPDCEGFISGAPDLAIEVLSPNDRAGEVLAKVQDWLDAGCLAVWIVDPDKRTIAVHRDNAAVVRLTEADTLSVDDILPGFRLRVTDVFR